jgi:dephospho-CoA kinase
MLRVGLTGGIGSGKSAASKIFAEQGAFIFDSDAEAKQILETNKEAQQELIAEFSTDIIGADGAIDRRKLARVGLQDEDHQLRLNAIVHPYVFNRIDKAFEKVSQGEKYSLFMVDGALIYESGYDQHLDYVIVVTALFRHRLERALQRGNLTRDEILKRMDLQWSEEEKLRMADFVIHNNDGIEELRKQVLEIYRKLT